MDNPEPPTVYAKSGAQVTPLLRTVLLADLVDSTAIIEKLGDVRAASLLQRLDLHLRNLLEITNGRLIDKADGLFALFERPIQAVDFAMRYQRALMELGREEGVRLQARVGMHVGEVMTWANPPQAVAAGAKPLEVEGLAKPVAARLMSLALPGQILLSGMAQSLAHRAQAELGVRAGRLRWLVHGRYRFKGVPAPMLVHEVGESDLAPLRMPPSGVKVWREVPLWRRPPVLALELLVVTGLVFVSLYSAFKSPPALAFNERDWVVVGDLNNLTSNPRLDDPLETALRISLQQSAYVNLIAQPRVDEALARMARKPGTPIDRSIGSEIAQREGAKALLLPTLTEVGGKLRISLEVVDPNTQVTVYTETAEGKGEQSVLASLDAVNTDLRAQLGEKVKMIDSSNKPLAQVTTKNLEALRAFSLANKARIENRNDDAMALLQRAVQLDPDFAMAYLSMGSIAYSSADTDGMRRYFDLAKAKREHLTDREAQLLDGGLAVFGTPEQALRQWKLVSAMYPDEYRAYYNYAFFAHNDAQQDRKALDFIEPATAPQNPARRNVFYLIGELNLTLDKYDRALAAFEQADSLGVRGLKRQYAETYAATRRYAAARKVLASQTTSGDLSEDVEQRLSEISFAVDQGQWGNALKAATVLEPLARKAAPLTGRTYRGIGLSLRSYDPDTAFRTDLRNYLQQQTALLAEADALDRRHLLFEILSAGWMAANTGDVETARLSLTTAGEAAREGGFPANSDMALLVQAELNIAGGKPADAVTALQPRIEQGDELYFLHAVLMRAYGRNKQYSLALQQAEWLTTHRGRAYGEFNSLNLWQPANVIESDLALLAEARYAEELGQTALAKKKRAAFATVWPDGEKLKAVTLRTTGE
jgi:putative peptide modification system cyclase